MLCIHQKIIMAKKCPQCGHPGMTVAEAIDLGHEFPDGTSMSAWYCDHCGNIYY